MYSFKNDYSEGADRRIMEALLETNLVQTPGYGTDDYCEEAREAIRREIRCADADVYFIPGGTQTNLIMISSMLRSYEAVIGTEYAHINVHETGAIEATGHKVLTVPAPDGKLTPEGILPVLKHHTDCHMVKPRMVYISDSTELGTIYTKAELTAISDFCKEQGLYLYLDGARLGAALVSEDNDLTMADIAALTDCFYIGGTKNGALFGEALVITNPALKEDFAFGIKQRGAMFAKGRLLGIQFKTLFTDGLFYELAEHAYKMAMELKNGLTEQGVTFLADSPTNQQFPIFTNEEAAKLEKAYEFEVQREMDEKHTCIRLVTSWATVEEEVKGFLEFVKNMRAE